jgi:hypothetical protein
VTGYDCCPPNPLERSRRAASHRGNKLPRAVEDSSLYDWAAGNETVDDHDYGDDKEDMDQRSTHVQEESETPKDEENNRYGPKHDGTLARCE